VGQSGRNGDLESAVDSANPHLSYRAGAIWLPLSLKDNRCLKVWTMRVTCLRTVVAISAACLIMGMAGCSNSTNSHDEKALGPMPTSPPPGSPYARPTASDSNTGSMDRSQFLSKLQQLPSAQRGAFVKNNSRVVSEIMAGTDESAKKTVSAAMVESR